MNGHDPQKYPLSTYGISAKEVVFLDLVNASEKEEKPSVHNGANETKD